LNQIKRFYSLGPPRSAKPSLADNVVYGTVEWYDKYQDAELEKVRYEQIKCSLDPRHDRRRRIGNLRLILPTSHIGDFIWTIYSECIVSDRVLNLFKDSGFSGFEARTSEIVRVRRLPKNERDTIPRIWELVTTGTAGDASPESGIRLLYRCPVCDYTRYSSFQEGIIVDAQQWDGTDFFTVKGYPSFTLIAERVKDLIVDHRLTNCAIIKATDLRWGKLPRPEEHPENFIPAEEGRPKTTCQLRTST